MTLLGRYLEEALRDMEKNRVHFVFFGDLSKLSPACRSCAGMQSSVPETIMRSR